jgi:quercetin dioxygenase-like cupin family protein
MKKSRVFPVFIITAMLSGTAFAFIGLNQLKPRIIVPSEMKWVADPKQSGGMETMVLAGDPRKEGLYTMRIKVPPGMKLFPHFHPDNRNAVILSGTFYYNYGEKFDESELKEMPAGTFFTEPARQPHYAWAKGGEVIIQVTGVGPSGTTQLNDGGTAK